MLLLVISISLNSVFRIPRIISAVECRYFCHHLSHSLDRIFSITILTYEGHLLGIALTTILKRPTAYTPITSQVLVTFSISDCLDSPKAVRNRLQKTEEFLDSLDNITNRREQSLNPNYRFLNNYDNQELDRSMSSVIPSRGWKSVTNRPAEYYDSIDNNISEVNQATVDCSINGDEAMVEYDSLEPSCSDCGDLV